LWTLGLGKRAELPRLGVLPEKTKLAIVAESPPRSGRYIYDETGSVSEPFLAAADSDL
jgi:hypothetical protein